MAQGVNRNKFKPTTKQKRLIEKFLKHFEAITKAREDVAERKRLAREAGNEAIDAGVPRVVLIESAGSEGAVSRILRG